MAQDGCSAAGATRATSGAAGDQRGCARERRREASGWNPAVRHASFANLSSESAVGPPEEPSRHVRYKPAGGSNPSGTQPARLVAELLCRWGEGRPLDDPGVGGWPAQAAPGDAHNCPSGTGGGGGCVDCNRRRVSGLSAAGLCAAGAPDRERPRQAASAQPPEAPAASAAVSCPLLGNFSARSVSETSGCLVLAAPSGFADGPLQAPTAPPYSPDAWWRDGPYSA